MALFMMFLHPERRREIQMYLEIFNDYLDFKILPWSRHGHDKGVYYPIRKNALRLMKIEHSKQKWQAYEESQNPQQNQQQQSQNQESEYGFAVRNSRREEKNRRKHARGETYTEVITNSATFPVPDYDDAVNWDEKSWLKYASPLELDDWYKEHPEDKPEGWVSPRAGLKSREEDEAEVAAEQLKKLESMNKRDSGFL
jgi:hypothetical protein